MLLSFVSPPKHLVVVCCMKPCFAIYRTQLKCTAALARCRCCCAALPPLHHQLLCCFYCAAVFHLHGDLHQRQHADAFSTVQSIFNQLSDGGVQALARLHAGATGVSRKTGKLMVKSEFQMQSHIIKACDVLIFGKELCWALLLQLTVTSPLRCL